MGGIPYSSGHIKKNERVKKAHFSHTDAKIELYREYEQSSIQRNQEHW